jgi:hypothetical protein
VADIAKTPNGKSGARGIGPRAPDNTPRKRGQPRYFSSLFIGRTPGCGAVKTAQTIPLLQVRHLPDATPRA